MRLIDADALFDALEEDIHYTAIGASEAARVNNLFADIRDIIQAQPTVEAEPIHHSTRKDENGVEWIFGEYGWERKEE